MQGLPGIDPQALLESLDTPPSISVRFNPFKISAKPEGCQVPWCRYGFYLDQRPEFTLDPALHGGAYYVQEAASMFVGHILEQAFGSCEGLRVLDLCASPGGKTTLLSTLVGLEGIVVANETVNQRVGTLVENVAKWGLGNVAVTYNDPMAFNRINGVFDAIIVDAPCSGEGMMRKNPKARAQWSEKNVELCAARQRRILADAWSALRQGGVMIYSTCTFNSRENEDNVEWLAREFDCQTVHIETEPSWGVSRGEAGGMETFRFYPGASRSEGFFAAAVRKADGKKRESMPSGRGVAICDATGKEVAELSRWVEQPSFMRFARIGEDYYGYYAAAYSLFRALAGYLTVVHSGVPMGQIFHGSLRPGHSLALFPEASAGAACVTELTLEEALKYLRKQNPDPSAFGDGINMVRHEGLAIGWAKKSGAKVNNMYPKEWRILR